MNIHTCKTITNGCFRCELNEDEIAAFKAEDARDAQEAWIEYRNKQQRERPWADAARVSRQLRKSSFIAGFMAGREG